MKKGDVHYIVFKTDNSIEKHETFDSIKNNVKFVIKREFQKFSKGSSHKYFSNIILDDSLNINPNNSFKWNGFKFLIKRDEKWEYFDEIYKYNVILHIEIFDYFNISKVFRFRMEDENVFEKIRDTFLLLENFGSHKSVIIIKKLNERINNLEKRIILMENSIPNL